MSLFYQKFRSYVPVAIVKSVFCFVGLVAVATQPLALFANRAFSSALSLAPTQKSRLEFVSANEQQDDLASHVRLQVPADVDLGADPRVVLMLTNDSQSIEEFEVSYGISATINGGENVGIVAPVKSVVVQVFPNGNKSLQLVGKWDVLQPLCSVAEFVSFSSTVTRKRDGKKWTFSPDIPIGGLPVAISASIRSPVSIGSELSATVRISNPLSQPLANAAVKISTSSQRLFIDGYGDEETVKIGILGAFEIRVIRPAFRAKLDGYSSISASFSADGFPSGSAAIDMNIFRCPGDLNEDTIVDDADLGLFLKAYELGECRSRRMDPRCVADLNHDELVNEADFQLFVTAYDAFACNPPAPEP
ncbi:MAG: hypothetical protein ACREJD_11130 [Phycisphaerales bacterium]